MRVFTRVVERRSFALAAEDLGLPRSSVTDAVKQLETRLGVRLLQRTTRHVTPTLDGEAYHRRCLALITDLEDAEAAFGGSKPKVLLRVDVHGILARHFVLPRLPDFLAEDPEFRERFRREAIAIARLRHPNILAVFDHGEFDGQPYIVTEFVEGGTFAHELGKPLAMPGPWRCLAPPAQPWTTRTSRAFSTATSSLRTY
jgi:DNA-binding transcriptional LysR family regulator